MKLITEFINMQRETWFLWAPPQLPATPCAPFVGGLFSRGPSAPSVALGMCERGGGVVINGVAWRWQTRVCVRVCTGDV